MRSETIEKSMRTLKLGGLAREWRNVPFNGEPEEYLKELLDVELREREVNRIGRIHHSHIVVFSGESYRLSQSMGRQLL